MTNVKIKTVSMNERGVIVIPEEMREDLGFSGKTNLVLIERGNEIIVKKEQDIAQAVENLQEDAVWDKIADQSLQELWSKEDAVWDKIAKKMIAKK